MGFLDQIVGATGAATGAGGPSGRLQSVMGMLTDNQAGGLQALVKALGDKGFGDIVNSWVGTGANLPGIVDKLTPGGQIPDAGGLEGLRKGLLD